MKVTEIEGRRRKPKPCPHCGAENACPDYTCPRLASVGEDGEGYVQYEYVTPQSPREIHLHFHGMTAEAVAVLTEVLGEPDPFPPDDGPKAA